MAATAASAVLALGGLPQVAAAEDAANPTPIATVDPTCTFQLGFANFARALPVEAVIGTCLENEHFNLLNGNSEQRTTRGLLYWRKSDNVTAFTDGYMTWLNGPYGVQSRLNSAQPFDWEVVGPIGPPPDEASDSSTVEGLLQPRDATQASITPPPPPPTSEPLITSGTINLRGADLTNSDRRGANLAKADLSQTKLTGADFTGAKLVEASLYGADVTRAIFYNADLTKADGKQIVNNGSRTSPGPNFRHAILTGGDFSQSKLGGADFREADMRNMDLSRASLAGADLRGADLSGADLSQADLTDANLSGANLTGALHTGTIFKNAITGGCTGCN
jgi:uncharacterized protein YjbI with pentapeptide repeats